MIKIENVQVWGFEGAIRGMRQPKNSFDKDDSYYDDDGYFHAGENNLKLMSALSNAGTDHGKFMRMIHVQCDITAPVFFDAELDTYKVATTRNSGSLQHKGASRDFTIDDFTTCDGDKDLAGVWISLINSINELRVKYNETKDYKYSRQMRALMPMGYNYRFTWDANYATLKNIYHARKHHALSEWSEEFCKWIETLPYAKELIIGGKNEV